MIDGKQATFHANGRVYEILHSFKELHLTWKASRHMVLAHHGKKSSAHPWFPVLEALLSLIDDMDARIQINIRAKLMREFTSLSILLKIECCIAHIRLGISEPFFGTCKSWFGCSSKVILMPSSIITVMICIWKWKTPWPARWGSRRLVIHSLLLDCSPPER